MKKEELFERGQKLERLSTRLSSQFEHTITNSRWFATIVIAETAGILKFTEVAKGGRFALMTFALGFLAISTLLLIVSIILAQYSKNNLEDRITDVLAKLAQTDLIMENIEAKDAKKESLEDLFSTIREHLDDLYKDLSSDPSNTVAVWCSYLGLSFFGLGTILAGIAILFG